MIFNILRGFLRICVKSALKNLVVRVLASHFGRFFGVFGWIRQNRFSKLKGISNNSFWQASESFRFRSASDKTRIIFK